MTRQRSAISCEKSLKRKMSMLLCSEFPDVDFCSWNEIIRSNNGVYYRRKVTFIHTRKLLFKLYNIRKIIILNLSSFRL